MGSNRFDTIFNREEYVPLVPELPAEMLYKVGKDMQDEQDADLQSSLKLQELFKTIKADPVDYPFKREMDAEYAPQFSRVTDMVIKGDPNARKELYALSAKFQTDPRVSTLAHNYELGQKARESYMSMGAQGKTSDLGWSNTWQTAADKRGGVLAPVPFVSHDPWFNPYDDTSKIMAGISDDLIKMSGEDFAMGPNGKVVIRGGSTERGGIDAQRVEQEANYNLDLYIQSPGGKSRIKDLQYMGVKDPAAIKKELLNDLFSTAHKQIFTRTGDSSTLAGAGDKYDFEETKQTYEESEPMDLEAAGVPEAIDILPKEGVSYSDIKNVLETADEKLIPQGIILGEGMSTKTGSWTNAYNQLPKKKKDFVNRVVGTGLPDVAGRIRNGSATDQDYRDANLLAYKVGKSVSGGKIISFYEGYSPTERDKETNDIFGKKDPTLKEIGAGKLAGRKFYNPRTNEVMSGQQFYNMAIQNATKLNQGDAMIQVTGENSGTAPTSLLTGDSNFDLSRTVSVGGTTYIMSSAAEEYVNTPYGQRDLKNEAATNNVYYNMQWGLPTVKAGVYSINKDNGVTIVKESYDGKATGETRYNPTSKQWETSVTVDGKPFTYKTDRPDSIRPALLQFYSSLKSKK